MITDSLLFCTAAPLVFGFLSANKTREQVKSKWYQNVKKPFFNPSRHVFAPIWIYLYISTGYALYLVQSTKSQLPFESELALKVANWGIFAFWAQLVTNILWSNLYFVKKEIYLAVLDISALVVLSLFTTICFLYTNTLAGFLMIPYIIWASFAFSLTYSVKELNPNFKEPSKN